MATRLAAIGGRNRFWQHPGLRGRAREVLGFRRHLYRRQEQGHLPDDAGHSVGQALGAGIAAAIDNPSFLAIHPTRKFLYTVNENSGDKSGSVTAFALDPKTGELTKINEQPSVGDGPCHLVVDATGKNVLVANYNSGSVTVLPIGSDGELAPASESIKHTGKVFDARRQGKPHAHSINLDKGNRFAVVADLGLDRVFVYKFDSDRGKLTPNDPPAAKVKDRSGPRHFAFHPDGKHAYVINEINCTVTAFDYDPEPARSPRSRRWKRCPFPSGPSTRPPKSWSTRPVNSCMAPTAATTAWLCTRSSRRPAG